MARFIIPQADSVSPILIRSSHWHKYLGDIIKDYILTGFGLSAGAGLNVNVAAGRGYVRGIDFESDAQESVAVVANSTNYIFAQLTFDGELEPTGWTFVVNQTGTPPSNSILLGTATTDGSGVTGTSTTGTVQGLQLKKFAAESGVSIAGPGDSNIGLTVGQPTVSGVSIQAGGSSNIGGKTTPLKLIAGWNADDNNAFLIRGFRSSSEVFYVNSVGRIFTITGILTPAIKTTDNITVLSIMAGTGAMDFNGRLVSNALFNSTTFESYQNIKVISDPGAPSNGYLRTFALARASGYEAMYGYVKRTSTLMRTKFHDFITMAGSIMFMVNPGMTFETVSSGNGGSTTNTNGGINLNTAASANSAFAMIAPSSASFLIDSSGDFVLNFAILGGISLGSACEVEVGLSNATTANGFASTFIGLRNNSAVDTNWHAITSNSGSTTDTDTTKVLQNSVYHYVGITKVSGTIYFFYDGDLVATHTTNIPSTNTMRIWAYIKTTDANQKTIKLSPILFLGSSK